jgi:hypothetical protein
MAQAAAWPDLTGTKNPDKPWLEELRRAGRIKGKSELTEKGWAEYTALIASGFIPSRQKVIWTLQGNQRVPSTMVDTLASLMLDTKD